MNPPVKKLYGLLSCLLGLGSYTFKRLYPYIVVVVYSGVRLELPIAMHTGIIKRNTQCMYR